MRVLADTSVWCDFFRKGEPALASLMEYDFLAIHPLVIGELATGNLPRRAQTLADLHALPLVETASYEETHFLLKQQTLWQKDLRWNDLLILASVVAASDTLLWTKAPPLAQIAHNLSVLYLPQLPTPNSQLLTPNSQLPTPNSQLPTPNF